MAKSVPNAYFGRGGVTKTVILEARRGGSRGLATLTEEVAS